MRRARAAARLAGVLLVTLAMLPSGLLVAGGAAVLGRREGALALRLLVAHQRVWARGLLAVLGVRVTTRGALGPRAAEEVVAARAEIEGEAARGRHGPGAASGTLIACNHVSYVDILVLAASRPCRFVAKSEVAGWPGIGLLARMAGVVFVERGRRRDLPRVSEAIARTLGAGLDMVVFLEGTSSRGEGVLDFHASLLQPACAGGLPCRAAAIGYETPDDEAAPALTVCWWGTMTLAPHVWNLMKLGRIDATLSFGEAALRSSERKQLARRLQAEVARMFVPVRQGERRASSRGAAEARVPAGSA